MYTRTIHATTQIIAATKETSGAWPDDDDDDDGAGLTESTENDDALTLHVTVPV